MMVEVAEMVARAMVEMVTAALTRPCCTSSLRWCGKSKRWNAGSNFTDKQFT